MKYHEFKLNKHRSPTRVGRGIAAGKGKTAGRGTKGQMSRTGARRRPGFEGGQNPLMQRLPKLRGFRSLRQPLEIVYTDQLAALSNKVITNQALAEAGLINSAYSQVKVLNRGEVNKKVSIELQAASKSALEAIAKADGTFTKADRLRQQKQAASKTNTPANAAKTK